MAQSLNKKIKGSGGGKGGGGGRAAVEAQNTLRSASIVRVLELLSEGEIVGVEGGLKGVFLNDTPVMNDDGSKNFDGVSYDERFGLPSQAYMAGFPSAEAEVNVGIPVTAASPATKTTSSGNVDAVRVTVLLPNGLSLQDTKSGDLNGHTVQFQFDVKSTASGAWQAVGVPITISGKSVTPYEKQYRLERPAGTGTWDIRLRRVSPDPVGSAERSNISFSRMTEIQDIKLEYQDSAYVGVAVDAKSVGNAIPVRSYLVKGLKINIPSNYNPVTRAYVGPWDGSFQTAWSDNPAWVLYDLLTNERYGMGEFIKPSQVDKFSFYDAAVYNDQLVPDGKGGQEPRFTFNTIINARTDALTLLQNVAGSFRSTLTYSGGLVGVNQDRPSSPVKLVTKANVIEGKFTYSSTGLQDRHTAINMTWNDKADRYLPKVTTVTDPTGIARYGYNLLETAAFGATTEGQAYRNAKWMIDTEINQTELCNFKMSLNGFDLNVGDVIKIYDEDYTNHVGAGRIKSATSTTITLDRAVTIQANAKISVQHPSGVGLITTSIVNPPGTYTTVNVVEMAAVPLVKSDFIVESAIAARQFRIYHIRQDEPNILSLQCLYYDPNKYNRVELGIDIEAPIFSDINQRVIGNVTEVVVTPGGSVTQERVQRNLDITWKAPLVGIPAYYILKWRRNKGTWYTITNIETPMTEIRNVEEGNYDLMIYAVNVNGVQSSGTAATYFLDLAGGGGSALLPVTGLQVVGGGTNFTGVDCNVEWTNPVGNTNQVVVLKDFEVKVYNSNSTLLRTEYVESVAPGAKAAYQYTMTKNRQDSNNAPNRTFRIEVRARDTLNKTSSATQATFTNPAPAVLNNVSVLGAFQSVKVLFDKPADSDLAGYLIWMSTTTNFVPSAANLVADTQATFTSFTGLLADTSYFVRVAAYDSFGSSKTGAGLNVSGQFSAATFASVGVQSGPTLPTSGMKAGDQFFNTTDNRLYTYTGTVWKGAGIAQGPTTPTTGTEGDLFANTTDGKLYQYHNGSWSAAVQSADFIGQLVTNQIADNAIAASKIADGAVTGTKIADNAIAIGKIADGAVTGTKIADNAVAAGKIADGAITGIKIALGAVGDTKLADNAVTSLKIAANAVTAAKTAIAAIDPQSGNLTANSVTAAQITTGAITAIKIQAGTITANEIAGSTITGAKIAGGTITAGNLAAGTITANEIAAGAITGNKIAANSITGDRIVAGSITASLIAAGTITANEIASNSITGDRIKAGGITADKIAAGTITAAQIAVNSIEGDRIKAGGITADKIAAGTITADIFGANSINGSKIVGGSITGDKIFANTITSAKIAAGTIEGDRIAASTITGGKIAAATIEGSNIKGNTITGNLIVGNTITADKLNVINLNAISSVLGSVTLDNGSNGGTLRTSGKGWHNDGVNGVIMYKDTARSFFEAKAGNDCISVTSDGGSSVRFGTPGSETFYVDSAGNMRINKVDVIGTLQIRNNSVTVPGAVNGWGGVGRLYYAGHTTQTVWASQMSMHFPAAARVQILVTWQAAAGGNNGSNALCEVTCDGSRVLFSGNSNIKGYNLSHVASANVHVGAGTHTFLLKFGNDWQQDGFWELGNWSITVLGVMK